MITKDPKIINEPLLASYLGKPCILTGSINTHAHHRCKRSHCRLDVEDNLVPLDDWINTALEDGLEDFENMLQTNLILISGADYVLIQFMIDHKFIVWRQIYEWLIDADKSVYNSYKGKMELSTNIRKSKTKKKWATRKLTGSTKIPSRPFSKSKLTRKKMS